MWFLKIIAINASLHRCTSLHIATHHYNLVNIDEARVIATQGLIKFTAKFFYKCLA